MAGQLNHVVPVRYPEPDLEIIEAARTIMGQTISQFTRSASVTLAKAIIAAAADAGIQRSTWDASRIEGSLEAKP
jgi:hypothetical protein